MDFLAFMHRQSSKGDIIILKKKTRSRSRKKNQLRNLIRWRQVSGHWGEAAQVKGNRGDLNSPTHTNTCPLQSDNTLIATSTHHI